VHDDLRLQRLAQWEIGQVGSAALGMMVRRV